MNKYFFPRLKPNLFQFCIIFENKIMLLLLLLPNINTSQQQLCWSKSCFQHKYLYTANICVFSFCCYYFAFKANERQSRSLSGVLPAIQARERERERQKCVDSHFIILKMPHLKSFFAFLHLIVAIMQ